MERYLNKPLQVYPTNGPMWVKHVQSFPHCIVDLLLHQSFLSAGLRMMMIRIIWFVSKKVDVRNMYCVWKQMEDPGTLPSGMPEDKYNQFNNTTNNTYLICTLCW